MADATIYDDKALIPFLADQIASQDALLTFVVECIRTSETYDIFRTKVIDNLSEVKIVTSINLDEWIKGQKEGYIASVKYDGNIDYLRQDDGLPQIFATPEDAFKAKGDAELIRIINLREEYEKRN